MRSDIIAAWIGTAFVLTGCAAGSTEPEASVEGAGTLLELQLDGAKLEFVEVEPGLLMVMSQTARGVPDPLAREDIQGLDVLDLYERLAGREPPLELLEAEERSQRLGGALEPVQRVGVNPQALTAAEFFSTHCDGMALCYLDQTANREWGEYRVYDAHGVVDAVSGTVAVQIRHRRVRDWSNDQYIHVPQGEVKHWVYFSPRTLVQFRLKVAVYEVDPGDRYHFTMSYDD